MIVQGKPPPGASWCQDKSITAWFFGGRIDDKKRICGMQWDVRTDRRTCKGPPNPTFFLAAKNEDRRTAVLFCRSARPRTPFFGGTIDDKKGMRGHRMGCQNWPKNEQRPPKRKDQMVKARKMMKNAHSLDSVLRLDKSSSALPLETKKGGATTEEDEVNIFLEIMNMALMQDKKIQRYSRIFWRWTFFWTVSIEKIEKSTVTQTSWKGGLVYQHP